MCPPVRSPSPPPRKAPRRAPRSGARSGSSRTPLGPIGAAWWGGRWTYERVAARATFGTGRTSRESHNPGYPPSAQTGDAIRTLPLLLLFACTNVPDKEDTAEADTDTDTDTGTVEELDEVHEAIALGDDVWLTGQRMEDDNDVLIRVDGTGTAEARALPAEVVAVQRDVDELLASAHDHDGWFWLRYDTAADTLTRIDLGAL